MFDLQRCGSVNRIVFVLHASVLALPAPVCTVCTQSISWEKPVFCFSIIRNDSRGRFKQTQALLRLLKEYSDTHTPPLKSSRVASGVCLGFNGKRRLNGKSKEIALRQTRGQCMAKGSRYTFYRKPVQLRCRCRSPQSFNKIIKNVKNKNEAERSY